MVDLIIVIYLNVAIKNSLYLWLIQFVSKIYNDHNRPPQALHPSAIVWLRHICKMQAMAAAASAYSSNLWSQSLVTLSVQAAVHQLDIWPINIDSCHDCWLWDWGSYKKYTRMIVRFQRSKEFSIWQMRDPRNYREQFELKALPLICFFFSFFSYDKHIYSILVLCIYVHTYIFLCSLHIFFTTISILHTIFHLSLCTA